jgi:hypothetical protein
VWNRFCPERWGGRRRRKVAQIMYTHVSKCKNDKITERKKDKIFCMKITLTKYII